MATAMEKKVAKEGAVLPFSESFPGFPRWLERLDELLFERWAPLFPNLKLHEELASVPPIDVYEEGGALVMKAELPGMKKEEIEVGIVDDVLTISGKKEKEEKVERKDYLRYERSTGAFTRRVKLPSPVLIDKVTARYENGVLEIRAPKAEPAKAAGHKVAIT
jgi:HSP20 family protein